MRCPRGRAAAAHRSAPCAGGRAGAAARGHLFASFCSRPRIFLFGCPVPPLVPAVGRFGGPRADFPPLRWRGGLAARGGGCAAPGGAVRECRRQGTAPAGPCPSAALPASLPSAERSISRGRSAGALGRGAPAKLRAVRGGGGCGGAEGLRKPERGRGSIRCKPSRC